MSRILIADDQRDVLEALRILLKGEGHQTDAVTSLAGAGLLIKGFANLRAANPGFDPSHAVVGELVLPKVKYPDAVQHRQFFDQLMPKLAGLPGVEAVGGAMPMPFSGNDRASTFTIVLRQSLIVVGLGLLVGLISALSVTRLMAALLYGVGANDFGTYAIVVLLLGTAALVASYLPARRAMAVDPIIALRYE